MIAYLDFIICTGLGIRQAGVRQRSSFAHPFAHVRIAGQVGHFLPLQLLKRPAQATRAHFETEVPQVDDIALLQFLW